MHKVLIVDDDRALTLALKVRLKAMGFDVQACGTADDASQCVLRWRPDVIILDIELPSYTGLEFHECLRYSAVARDIPVVYLSGHDSDSHRRIAHQQGARAFVVKPYDPDDLGRTLYSVMGVWAA